MGGMALIKRGTTGKFLETSQSRKWERARNASYKLSIKLKTVKKGQPILTEEIVTALNLFFGIILLENKGQLDRFYHNKIDTIIIDIKIPTTKSPSEIVNILKSRSSRMLKEDRNLKKIIRPILESGKGYGKSFWGGGYSILSEYQSKIEIDFIEI